MRKWMILIVALVFVFGCGKREKEEAAEAAAVSSETVAPVSQVIDGNFESAINSIAEGDISRGVGMLLDITLLTGPDSDLPEGFKDRIEQARTSYQANDMAAGGEYVREALKIWNPSGEEEDVSGDVENMIPGPVAQIFRNKIIAARDLMKQGDAKTAVATILEALSLLSPAKTSPDPA